MPGRKRASRPQKHRKGHRMGLLESATAGPAGELLGMTVWGQQFLGWRFSLATASRITHVGGHLRANIAGTGLFAAIVKLSVSDIDPCFCPSPDYHIIGYPCPPTICPIITQ